MRPDPPLRKDRRCARKGCSKRLKVPAQTLAAREVYERDPFCTSVCCKIYHGVIADPDE